MLERNKENEELVREYRELVKKSREAKTISDKEYYSKLASEKHDEMFIREFGDRNFKRFNSM